MAGGLSLLPIAFIFEPNLPTFEFEHYYGIFYLSIIGAAFTYILWFRAISIMQPNMVSVFGFLSPLTAVIVGWIMLDQALGFWQIFGAICIISAILLAQRAK